MLRDFLFVTVRIVVAVGVEPGTCGIRGFNANHYPKIRSVCFRKQRYVTFVWENQYAGARRLLVQNTVSVKCTWSWDAALFDCRAMKSTTTWLRESFWVTTAWCYKASRVSQRGTILVSPPTQKARVPVTLSLCESCVSTRCFTTYCAPQVSYFL
jgi:hypothetical protein